MTDLAQLIASLRAGTVTPADLDAAADALAGKVKVKPLEWETPSQRNNYTHIARSIFGDYYVHVDGGRHQAWFEAHVKPYENAIGPEVGSLLCAQAAAQADYAARILAALEPAPLTVADALTVPEVQALVVAARAAVARWISTDWKAPPTADTMNSLQSALRGIGGAE